MKFFTPVVSFCLLTVFVVAPAICAETPPKSLPKPSECAGAAVLRDPSFAMRTIDFASRLADLGPRPAAGEGEVRARQTVRAALEEIGLEVTIEPFDYQTFTLKKSSLTLAGHPVEPVIIGFDPFQDQFEFKGKAIVITDPSQAADTLRGTIVVTNHPLMQLMIAQFDPAVVISVEPDDLEAFIDHDNLEVSLQISGELVVLSSANLIARLGSLTPSGREILVTSHIDAYQDSPGANDNGTGLGLMIELARAFSNGSERPNNPITYVAFGAEENGAIGSRAYIQDHLEELPDIVAVVNLDTLGGARGPVIATTPTESPEGNDRPIIRVPQSLRGRAWEGPEGRWRITHPAIIPTALTSNYPPWLQRVVNESATKLQIEIEHKDLISDHRTFALSGVPAISMQSQEHHIHSEQDTADALVTETISACARLTAEIVCRLQAEAVR